MSEPTTRLLIPGDEAALERFLLPRVESSLFLISNMRSAGLVDCGLPYSGTCAAAFQGDQVVGIVAHYWNGYVVLQAPVHLVDALWRKAVGASHRPIEALLGPDAQVEVAREALGIDASKTRFDEVARLYSLRLADLRVPDGLRSGRLSGRRMEPHDLELIARWQTAYSIETLGETESPQLQEECQAAAQCLLEEERAWVLEERGRPVACSSFKAVIREAVQVGDVWTPPELRGRGYGRSVVAASLLDARRIGVEKAVLFTGECNVAAQKAYAALGFRHIGCYWLAILRSPLEVGSLT